LIAKIKEQSAFSIELETATGYAFDTEILGFSLAYSNGLHLWQDKMDSLAICKCPILHAENGKIENSPTFQLNKKRWSLTLMV